jgi:tyrosyl-tRNA synthetase
MTGLLAELTWRGFVHDATPGLDAHLARGPVTAYCGFDPTSPSLQLGNLIPLMLLKQLQLAGHRPIVLMGGGTGLIGDPSGKKTERPLLPKEELRANLERQRAQMSRFLDFEGDRALLRNNADWLIEARLVDFLRDTGKHFTVNIMLQKESVKARLDAGLSFTEFAYMLLQAYDYLQLFEREHCTLQVGGSDQWGNITAGVELVRRVKGAEAHGLVAPLITTAAGAKFGKSEAGAIYLDPSLTSPYQFYQFWLNTDDRYVGMYLRLFTLRSQDEIDELLREHQADPSKRVAQRALGMAVTIDVHGPETVKDVAGASSVLFGELDPRAADARVLEFLSGVIATAQAGAAASLVDAVVIAGLASSKGEARRHIAQGGIYINGKREPDVDRMLAPTDRLAGGFVLLRKGKKDYALLRVGDS